MRPVFIHAGFRSASTYVWTKFRDDPKVMGFFEPFSEDLAWADRAFIERHDPSGWVSGHPDTAPYFLEYLPLLKAGGGIAGFDPTYSYAQYFVTRHVFPSPRPYLSSLMDLAGEGAKTPVLGFCRSLGRLSWLKSAYPSAVNIVLVRNPVQQWLSAYQFKERDNNEYFLLRPVVIAQNPGENAHMRRFFQVFGRVLRGKQFDLDTLWGTFLNVYGAGLLAAVGHADLVIDVDRLSTEPGYQLNTSQQIERLTDIAPDFGDCIVGNHAPAALLVNFRGIGHNVLGSLRDSLKNEAAPPPEIRARQEDILRKIEQALK